MGSAAPRPAFVGEDRRRGPAPAGLGRVFVGGAATVLVTAVALAAFASAGDPLDAVSARDLRIVLDTATVAVGLGVFVLCVARLRLAGESPPLWAGTAVLVYGLVAVGGGVLAAVGAETAAGAGGGEGVTAGSRAGLVAALALLVAGVVAAPVDTRLRAGPLLAGAAALTLALTVTFAAAPGVGRALTVGGVEGPGAATTAGGWLAAAAWLALACAYVVKGFRHRRVYAWCGVLTFALLLAQLADAAEVSSGNRWAVAAAALRTVGFLAAAVGCGLELAQAYTDQRSRLFDSELTLEAAAVSDRLERASRRAQRHDVRNAVVAIEGAAVTLERYRDRLSPDDRASLTRVLSSGVERLQNLLGDGRGAATVALGAAAGAVVADMGWADRVAVDVPPELAGLGAVTQTAEVIRLLLDNADRRAPGAPIAVDGRVDGTWAVLRVADLGPRMSRQGRRSVSARFDAQSPGSGDIGLLVAVRLMRDQGGDLWVEESPNGGAFALCLPLGLDGSGDHGASAGAS